MTDSTTLSVRMPKKAKERLEALARSMGRSTNYVARQAIDAFVDENAWQVEEIRKAVEKADQGGPFYRHEDVMNYLDALARGEDPPRPPAFRTR